MKVTRKNGVDGFKVTIEMSEIKDLNVINLAIANEMERYRKMGWDFDKELKGSYQRMEKVYRALHESLFKNQID